MKVLCIWNDVDHVTERYHQEGGIVVIADNLEAALQMIRDKCPGCDCKIPIRPERHVGLAMPDYMAKIVAYEDKIFLFPNAGCC